MLYLVGEKIHTHTERKKYITSLRYLDLLDTFGVAPFVVLKSIIKKLDEINFTFSYGSNSSKRKIIIILYVEYFQKTRTEKFRFSLARFAAAFFDIFNGMPFLQSIYIFNTHAERDACSQLISEL